MRSPDADLPNCAPRRAAFTLLEVMVSAALIAMAMGSILMMNMRAGRILRASRQVAAASQVLQQRIEMIRDQPWTEVSRSQALASLMKTPTDSEAEMAGSTFMERFRVTVPKATAAGLVETDRYFSISRSENGVALEGSGDFASEPTLLFEGTAIWHDQTGVHQRDLRTIVCRYGLTRSGIVGTVLGHPGGRVSSGQ